MAFRLKGGNRTVQDNLPLLDGTLGAYDMLEHDDMSYARDDMLQERSAYELVREQLTDAQCAELDLVDAYWKAHAAQFNEAFRTIQAFESRKTAMVAWIEDERGDVPAVPADHWWWKPIEE